MSAPRKLKDVPAVPSSFQITSYANLTTIFGALFTFFWYIREKLNKLALQVHTYRRVMMSGDGNRHAHNFNDVNNF
jgi:hypothetical protein